MLKAIIVDDENYIRQGLRILIDWQKEGISIVGEASNGKQAIRLVELHKPDLILLDIKMPVMDGLDFLEYLRNTMHFNTHVIILSGYADFTFAQKAMKFNVKQYVLKPVEENELLKALSDVKEEIENEKNLRYKSQISYQTRKSMIIKDILSDKISVSPELTNSGLFNVAGGSEFFCLIIHVQKKWYSSYKNLSINQQRIGGEIEIITNVLNKADISDFVDLFEYNGWWGLFIDYRKMVHKGLLTDQFLNNIKNILIEGYSRRVQLFMGKIVQDFPANIKTAYESACETIKLSFYEYNRIIYKYDEMKSSILNNYEEVIFTGDILDLVMNFNITEIKLKMENIFARLAKKRIDPEVIKIRLNYLVHKIADAISEIDGSYDRNLERYLVYNVNYTEINADELKEMATNFCINSALYIKNLKEVSKYGVAYRIKNFIDDHYSEDITLTYLADKFYMNSVYLGQMFKKMYNKKFNDYLNEVRIKEAKKLLKFTELKIYEVSEKVGFKKPEYFSKKFEELTGLSPSQFRESL